MESQRSSPGLALAAGCLATAAALLYFYSFDEPWALRGENKISLFPMAADAWRQWTSGHFPSWTSGIFAGFPLFAGSQSSALYLPHGLAFWLTPAPHWRAMDLALALHAGLLGAGCVRVLLLLGVRGAGAVLGALLTLMAPQIVYWTNFVPLFVSIAWWPWLLVAAERLGRPDRPALGGVVLGATAIAAQVLAGFVEYAVYSGGLGALWILASPGRLPASTRLVRIALLGSSTALLAAPQLLPSLLGLDVGARDIRGRDFLSVDPAGIAAFIDPRSGSSGSGLTSVFFGGATLLLAAGAVVLRAPRSLLLASLAGLTALLALGSRTPLYDLLTALPVFDLFRGPVKFLVASQVFVAFLAALGFESLLRRSARSTAPIAISLAAWTLAALAVAEHTGQLALQLPLVARPHLKGEYAVPADMTGFEAFLPDLSLRDPTQGPPPRVLHASYPGTFGSLAQVYGVESVLGSPPAMLGTRAAALLRPSVMDGLPGRDSRWLDRFGVQLVVARDPCERFAGRRLAVLRREHGFCLLRNPSRPTRVELIERAILVGDQDSELQHILEHPEAHLPVVAPAAPPGGPPDWHNAGPLGPDENVTHLAYRPGAFDLRVTTNRERLLLVREARSPGWRAQLAGKPVPILPAGGLFFAVAVPPGEHEIVLRHTTPGLVAGLTLAGAWLLVVAVLWMRGRGVSSVPAA